MLSKATSNFLENARVYFRHFGEGPTIQNTKTVIVGNDYPLTKELEEFLISRHYGEPVLNDKLEELRRESIDFINQHTENYDRKLFWKNVNQTRGLGDQAIMKWIHFHDASIRPENIISVTYELVYDPFYSSICCHLEVTMDAERQKEYS